MHYFIPLRIHLEFDQREISTVTIDSLNDRLVELDYVNYGVVNGTSENGNFKALYRALKDRRPIVGKKTIVYFQDIEIELYLYAANMTGYEYMIEYLNRFEGGLSLENSLDLLKNRDIHKVMVLQNSLKLTEIDIPKVNFYWGLNVDWLDYQDSIIAWMSLTKDSLIAFPRVVYLKSYDAYDVYYCLKKEVKFFLPSRKRVSSLDYLMQRQDYDRIYGILPESIYNTFILFNSCESWFCRDIIRTNFYPDTSIYVQRSIFVRKVLIGLIKRGIVDRIYNRQALYEIRTIIGKDFQSYFLIIKEIAEFCKSRSIIIGPRGSAAGALVSYLLGISNIDPIRYSLRFERFLNPDRAELPDYDLDFPSSRRQEVIDFLRDNFKEKFIIAHILTYSHLKPRNALRYVGKTLGLSGFEIENLVKYVRFISTKKVTLSDTYDENTDLQDLLNRDVKLRRVYDLSVEVENLVNNFGIHAAGVVMIPVERRGLIESRYMKSSSIPVAQHDMDDLSYAGLVKFDILGIESLSIIDNIMNIRGIDIGDIVIDDPSVFEYLRTANTLGIFQITYLNSEILKRIRASTLLEIADVIGLNRPGSMDFIPEFIERKAGKHWEFISDNEDIIEITKPTLGIFIWQEQIMNLSIKVANYTGSEADHLRKIIGKKIFDLMPREKDKFISRASKNLGLEEAEKLYSIIENFKGYGFNKSHGIAYALNSYYMMYLKRYYPLEYYLSWLNIEKDVDKRALFIQSASNEGIRIVKPSLKNPRRDFEMVEGAITFGINRLPKLSKRVVDKVFSSDLSDVDSLNSLQSRCFLTVEEVENLRLVGFREDLGFNPDRDSEVNLFKFVWQDLNSVSELDNRLGDWVFNFMFKDSPFAGFNVRILLLERQRGLNKPDNSRVKSYQNSIFVTISDGSYTLKLVESNSYIIQVLKEIYDKGENKHLFILDFSEGVRGIKISKIIY